MKPMPYQQPILDKIEQQKREELKSVLVLNGMSYQPPIQPLLLAVAKWNSDEKTT